MCLLVVHAAIIAHVLHWYFTGRSMGRTVFSDSMQTLERGEVNPGFVLFLLAIASTALVGRFFCGWMCHMGALQDLCAWLLRRIGVRPRLFRSRALALMPLALGLYMFVWPTVYREIANPLVRWAAPRLLPPVDPLPETAFTLTTRDLWEGLPSVWIAIPFLGLCGFGTVYFLGARGLCRYGCPYGSALLPVEHLSPARVRVDQSRCDQCGLCTKACTAGVRVHDQVRAFGAVLDQNCIKSLDCVHACPSSALSFSLTRPSLLRGAGVHASDLSWRQEFVCAGVAALVFFVARGLYGLIPMLMAATIAILVAFVSWKAMCLWSQPNVRLGALVLRRLQRLTRSGRLFLAAFLLLAALVGHSALIRVLLYTGGRVDDQVVVSLPQALAGQVPEPQRQLAERALSWYRLTQPIGHGGIALAPSPGIEIRCAWLLIVSGQTEQAEALLRAELERRPSDRVLATLGNILARRGRVDDSIQTLQAFIDTKPSWVESRRLLSSHLLSTGRIEQAERLYRELLSAHPANADALCGLGRMLVQTGRHDEGVELLRGAVARDPGSPMLTLELAYALSALRRVDEALAVLADLAQARPAVRPRLIEVGSDILAAAGRQPDIPRWRESLSRSPK